MKIKRNVKKFNNSNSKGCTQGTKLKSLGLGKYEFPTYNKVPGGEYFSEIKEARRTVSAKGKETIEVYYKIEDASTIYKIANGSLPATTKVDAYYIKQSYPIDTTYCDEFIDSMAEALGYDEFDIKDVVGVTEHVKLSYGSGNMGGFSKRIPFEREWYEELEKDQPEETNDEIELVPSCENTIANAYNEDDEFDDFLDDDDDDC